MMMITCPMCGHYGNISDKLVPEQGKYIVCPKCRERFFISRDQIVQGGQPDTSSGNRFNLEESNESIRDTDSDVIVQKVADQADLYHLVCPRCGAAVEKPENLKGNTFHCEYCNSIVLVK